MIYLITILLLLALVFHYDIRGNNRNRKKWYYIMLVIFILIAGLRYRLGIDTTRYLATFYFETPQLDKFNWNIFELGNDPLYKLFNSVVLTMGGKFYVVQLLHAAFVNTLIFKYIEKHTSAIFTSIFLYFIWQYCAMNMEEMRASMSIAVCLYANDYMLEKKWSKGILLYVIGSLFHVSTILVMAMPLLFFMRFNIVGLLIVVGAIFSGFIIQSFLGDYLSYVELIDSLSEKVDKYADKEKYMEASRNVYGYLMKIIPCIYVAVSILYMKAGRIHTRLNKVEPLIMVFLVFAMLAMNVPIAYRYMRFYIIYCIMFIAEFMVYLFHDHKKKSVVYMKAFIFLFPLFLVIARMRLNETTWVRYHPYSSIFDQKLDEDREIMFSFSKGDPPYSGKY